MSFRFVYGQAVCAALLIGSAVAYAQGGPNTAAASNDSAVTVIDVKATDGALTPLLKAEAAKAAKLGKLPVVEFSAVWCGPCHHLANSLGDARMIDAFSGVYVIRLDLDAWKSRLADAGFTVASIPAFYPITADGRPTGATINGGAWGEDIPENMAPPLKKFFREQEKKAAEQTK
jgi:hypothetical protein